MLSLCAIVRYGGPDWLGAPEVDWVTFAIFAVMFFGAFAMFGEVVALGAVIGLGYQAVQWVQTGTWPSYTLGSQLGVSADFAPTHWVMVDRLLHYVLFDVELAFIARCRSPRMHINFSAGSGRMPCVIRDFVFGHKQ